jgi:hypothetical protein
VRCSSCWCLDSSVCDFERTFRNSCKRTSKERMDHARKGPRRRACLLTSSRSRGKSETRKIRRTACRPRPRVQNDLVLIDSYNHAITKTAPNLRDASRIPLHKVLVKLLNLADVLFDTRAERGHTKMIRALLLPEPGPSDGADPSGVYESIKKKTTLATAQHINTEPPN